MTQFTVETYQNEFLALGGNEVHAIVSVQGPPSSVAKVEESVAVVIVLDTSGSMEGRKLREAKKATNGAIDSLRDGARFALVAGTDRAMQIFPQSSGLTGAGRESRSSAKKAIARLEASGGTAIGTWLSRAADLLALEPGIRRVILLTDGRNESETPEQLDATVQRCRGAFQCDCRGVGTDWEVTELRKVADALLGTVDIVAQPSGLAADFRAMTETAMGKHTDDVSIRITTPVGVAIRFLKQVAPAVQDLAGVASDRSGRVTDFALGAWGDEEREYHLCLTVPDAPVGSDLLAARVSVLVEDVVHAQGFIRATWTDDETASTRINRRVAHYRGQVALSRAIDDGLAAWQAGDREVATLELGQAARLAHDSGHEDTLRLLSRVVHIEDAASGRVALRSDASLEDEMTLHTRSTKTVRLERE